MITPLNLPKAKLKLRKKGEVVYVWCVIRKKDLVLTPEEWVRQHIIHYLINHKQYPEGLIASEYPLEYNGRSKRADVVVFNRDGQPNMIVECKAPEVKISKGTLNQAAQYNFELGVDTIFLTNGLNHVICQLDRESEKLIYLQDLPDFN